MDEPVPVIDLIVVSYGHARFMDVLFASLAKLKYPRDKWRLHVVINKDRDGTLEAVRRLEQMNASILPKMMVHEPHANLGFAGGNNVAMIWSMRNGGDYVYLLNPDTEIMPDALDEAVKVAQVHSEAGSIQSLLVRGQNPNLINSWGNELHFLGFGYCGGDNDPIDKVSKEPKEITYASGAGVLIPVKTLEKIGLLDETLHSYHEDLDFGWRVLLSGQKNLLAPKSIVRHYYEFSRSIQKWEFMERNRIAVVLKNYSLPSVTVLLPAIFATDVAIWAFSVKGGWLKEKFRASCWFLKPSTWRYIINGRRQIRAIRRVPDWAMLRKFTWKIEYQELKSGWAEKIANPFWHALYVSYGVLIRW